MTDFAYRQDAFGVSKDMKSTVRWTTKAGKAVTLKAKAAPVKAQVRVMNVGERLSSTPPRKSTRTRKVLRQIGGEAVKQIGYRPDHFAAAAVKVPNVVHLIAS